MKITIPSFLGVRPWLDRPWRSLAFRRNLALGRAFLSWWITCCRLYGYVKHVPQVYRILRYICTAKRVKKNGPESAADYRKVMANITLREVDEVPGKMFLPKCTAKSGTTGRVLQALMAKNEIFLKVPGTSHLRTPWAAGTCQSGIQYLKSNV